MGNGFSERDRREHERELENFVKGIHEGPDVRVSKTMVRFCSLSSSERLAQHYEQRKQDVEDPTILIRTLMEKLGDLTPSPALAGLGALALAILIDKNSVRPAESTKQILQSVFAEEKASEVWNKIDECLMRCMIHRGNELKLKSELEQLEFQLSAALIRLKNSMVRDGHMTTPALKAWVNGAAFHVHMLIHLVRLGGTQSCDPVKILLSLYESDLDAMFMKHKEMIESQCRIALLPDISDEGLQDFFTFIDEDSYCHDMGTWTMFRDYKDAYYNKRFMRQKHDIQTYFSQVRGELHNLVQQRGSFSLS